MALSLKKCIVLKWIWLVSLIRYAFKTRASWNIFSERNQGKQDHNNIGIVNNLSANV
jgi:hypothetical protein